MKSVVQKSLAWFILVGGVVFLTRLFFFFFLLTFFFLFNFLFYSGKHLPVPTPRRRNVWEGSIGLESVRNESLCCSASSKPSGLPPSVSLSQPPTIATTISIITSCKFWSLFIIYLFWKEYLYQCCNWKMSITCHQHKTMIKSKFVMWGSWCPGLQRWEASLLGSLVGPRGLPNPIPLLCRLPSKLHGPQEQVFTLPNTTSCGPGDGLTTLWKMITVHFLGMGTEAPTCLTCSRSQSCLVTEPGEAASPSLASFPVFLSE